MMTAEVHAQQTGRKRACTCKSAAMAPCSSICCFRASSLAAQAASLSATAEILACSNTLQLVHPAEHIYFASRPGLQHSQPHRALLCLLAIQRNQSWNDFSMSWQVRRARQEAQCKH